jgi:hypothetical protein
MQPDPAAPAEAVSMGIVDEPDKAIRVALYGADRRGVSIPVSPQFALSLAGQLIAAAARRLG